MGLVLVIVTLEPSTKDTPLASFQVVMGRPPDQSAGYAEVPPLCLQISATIVSSGREIWDRLNRYILSSSWKSCAPQISVHIRIYLQIYHHFGTSTRIILTLGLHFSQLRFGTPHMSKLVWYDYNPAAGILQARYY